MSEPLDLTIINNGVHPAYPIITNKNTKLYAVVLRCSEDQLRKLATVCANISDLNGMAHQFQDDYTTEGLYYRLRIIDNDSLEFHKLRD